VIGAAPLGRLLGELRAALRRRPAQEARLAGALRVLAPFEPELLAELGDALEVTARRGSFERPLYACAVRTLSECGDGRVAQVLAQVLAQDEAGGLASLAAACVTPARALDGPLARASSSRHPVTAFAAEVARLARGEPRGARLLALAPKIKEAHRIALCGALFVGLLSAKPLAAEVAPALGVLRDAERHLGRWLLLAELAARAGDAGPLAEARRRAQGGAASARGGWAFVAWALDAAAPPPEIRPSLELMARLSDRPSADRDASFLYRLAAARAPSARVILESLVRGRKLGDTVTVRAALHLCRDYGQEPLVQSLTDAARPPRKDTLRGLATAALYDCGRRSEALALARELETTRHLPALCWSGLVQAAEAGARPGTVVSELAFRRVEQGACE
jgi:hypothetical protein